MVEGFITADRVSKIERHVEQEREIDAKHVLEWRHSELTLSAGWKRYDHGQQKELREKRLCQCHEIDMTLDAPKILTWMQHYTTIPLFGGNSNDT